jgi:hypothetical protein
MALSFGMSSCGWIFCYRCMFSPSLRFVELTQNRFVQARAEVLFHGRRCSLFVSRFCFILRRGAKTCPSNQQVRVCSAVTGLWVFCFLCSLSGSRALVVVPATTRSFLHEGDGTRALASAACTIKPRLHTSNTLPSLQIIMSGPGGTAGTANASSDLTRGVDWTKGSAASSAQVRALALETLAVSGLRR